MYTNVHLHHHHGVDDVDTVAEKPRIINLANVIEKMVKRDSDEDECPPDDTSQRCQKPVGSQALPIGLGVGIPIGIAVIVLIFLHFKHVRKLKKEAEQDKDFDIDMEDYDPRQAQEELKNHPPARLPNGLQSMYSKKASPFKEKDSTEFDSSSSTTKHDHYDEKQLQRGTDPFMAAPYISNPDIAGSKNSLEEYSRSIQSIYEENKYPTTASVYSNGGVTPSFMLGGGSSIRYPSPVQYKNSGDNMSRISSRQSISDRSFASSSRLNVVESNGPGPEVSSPLATTSQVPKESPFSSKHDSDAESQSSRHSNDHQDFDFTPAHSARNSKFVIGDEDDELEEEQHRQQQQQQLQQQQHEGGLERSNTKYFDRVKSVYKEYMTDDDEDEEQARKGGDNDTDSIGELPSRSAPVEHHEPPPGFVESPVVKPPTPPSSNGSLQDDDHVEHKQVSEETREPQLPPQAHYPTPPLQYEPKRASPPMQYESKRVSPPAVPPPRNLVQPQELPQLPHDNSFSSSVYAPSNHRYYPSNPDEPFMHLPNTRPSNGSEYSAISDDRPFPPSISQQGRRSAQPLPKLESLSSPHSLNDTSSPIAFAPKARRKNNAHHLPPPNAFAIHETEVPSSPSSSSGALPSPHAMRQSVVMMSSTEFAPPKKFSSGGNGNRGRSGSASNATSPHSSSIPSPYGGSARGSYDNAVPRMSPHPQTKSGQLNQLVPDHRDNEMLRPTMDMRS